MQGGAWAVQGGGKVRDSCVGWAVWLGHAQGGLGCALGSPRIYLGQLASASRTKMRKVTSNPEVLGPSRSWSPAPAAPSIPRDLRTHLHRRGYCVGQVGAPTRRPGRRGRRWRLCLP